MRFLIYGAGALGQALGCLLGADSHKVDFILRKRFMPSLLEKGLQVSGILGDHTLQLSQENLKESVKDISGERYDYVLLTTKAYDTAEAISSLASIENNFRHIVSMQNGCGNVEQVKEKFGSDKTLGARVITGFEITAPGLVDITVSADAIHVGASRRGDLPASVTELTAAITAAGHPCQAVEDIYQSLFAKLLYNCTLNPLGAILGVPYGLLAEQEDTRKIMSDIIEETFEVITRLGGSTPWPDGQSYREEFFARLIPATYNHRPSMLQDLENGKPTEVDALTGYVSRAGHRLGIPTPACSLLTSLVKFKENSTI